MATVDPNKITPLEQERLQVDQLRREANLMRIPVSQASADIVKFVAAAEGSDPLLNGFKCPQDNPYYEKSSCTLI